MVRILLLAVLATLLIASPAAAAPTWLAPQNFETGLAAQPTGADMAVTRNGTAIAAWVARVGAADLARARVRLPGRGFGPVITLTPQDGRDASNIRVATDAQGNATLAWEEENGPGGAHLIRATRVPAGSVTAETAQTVSLPGATSRLPALAVGPSGVAVIAYTEGLFNTAQVLRAVIRNGPAGSFGTTKTVSDIFETDFADPVVGVADNGSAVIAWQRTVAAMPSVIEANERAPNGEFKEANQVTGISNSFFASTDPALAIAPNGTTVVLWTQGTPAVIGYNERTPAGTWLSDSRIASKTGQGGVAPAVAMDGAGNAIAAWIASAGSSNFIQAAIRPAGGTFSNHRDLTSTNGGNLEVAVNRRGDSVITFSGSMGELVGSVVRPSGGDFSGVIPAERQATITTALANHGLGIDDQGNASGIWLRNINPGDTYHVAAASLDAAAPTLNASVPPGGTAGTAIPMAAAAADRLTPVQLTWAFGDGGIAFGGAVSHAFGSAGAFTVRVTATDGVGNATTAARPLLVAAAPPPRKKRIRAAVTANWALQGDKIALVVMAARRVPNGTKARVTCKGKKCPFKRKASKKRRKGKITLFKRLSPVKALASKKRNVRGGQLVELRLTKRGFIGQVVRYRIKAGRLPVGKTLCLPVGAKKPRKRC
jgi:hypothetical protein